MEREPRSCSCLLTFSCFLRMEIGLGSGRKGISNHYYLQFTEQPLIISMFSFPNCHLQKRGGMDIRQRNFNPYRKFTAAILHWNVILIFLMKGIIRAELFALKRSHCLKRIFANGFRENARLNDYASSEGFLLWFLLTHSR